MYSQSLAQQAAALLEQLRERHPLVYHITNYVTVNDVANITLLSGALPIMAPSSHEAAEMAAHADSLVLNIGTPNLDQQAAMSLAGEVMNRRGRPIVLDPVGIGTTALRTEGVRRLLARLRLTVVRGNAGEIGRLAGLGGEVRGVESISAPEPTETTARLAGDLKLVAAATGRRDVVAGQDKILVVDNGHPLLSTVVGTGCMATAMIGCFLAVADDPLVATVSALACFGVAGELAAADAAGPGSFKVALFDRLHSVTPEILAHRARIAHLEEAPSE
ncbi:MAG: hydroxyethylthiazole kinase [Anaerolineae bacterium]